ncbi:hypothetical protein NT6N_09890 [Oceaniferula spumae]|uniref:TonB C-terminal domain-containing protein n=1 Tax=Oceaniferula spumae TaxID=2979115 RepID=A0AAT9FIX2_9BACT
MFFLSKRRQKRDQEAGLIFRWRGARKHHTGKLLALMIATGFFAFSVYAIRIDGEKTPLVSKRTASVFFISEDDPNYQNLLVQIEEKSPFPRRWDPAYDKDTMARISAQTDLLAGKTWKYEPELVALPREQDGRALPSIVDPEEGLLGDIAKTWELSVDESGGQAEGDLYVLARINADSNIQKRLQQKSPVLPRALVAEEWFGQSFRFMIGIDAKGIVRGCVSLSGEGLEAVKPSEKQKLLSAWLRSQRFLPVDSDQPVVIGVLELQIEALRE